VSFVGEVATVGGQSVGDRPGKIGAGLAGLSYASSPQSLIDLFFRD